MPQYHGVRFTARRQCEKHVVRESRPTEQVAVRQPIETAERVIGSEVTAQLASDIQALAAIGRPSASPGEHAAARWVQGRLWAIGLTPQIERFQFNPDYWVVWGAHGFLALAAAGLCLGGRQTRRIASLVGLVAAVSFWGELTTRLSLLRRLAPARTSYNVIARCSDNKELPVLIVSAHHDAPHSGLVFHPRVPRLLPSGLRWLTEPPAALKAPFGGMLMIALGAVAHAFGIRRRIVRRMTALGAIINAVFLALMWNTARTRVSPGANDNASGVAALLALARRCFSDPPANLNVWVLSTGSEEGMLGGMQAFWSQHRRQLEGRRVYVLNLEVLGSGRPVYLEGEGHLGWRSYEGELLALARELSQAPPFVDVKPLKKPPFMTDAFITARRGVPSLTIASLDRDSRVAHYHWRTDLPENIDLASVKAAYMFSHELIRQLAQDLQKQYGRRQER